MTNQRVCANTPVLSRRAALAALAASPIASANVGHAAEVNDHTSVESVQQRLNYFSEITDTTPPKLAVMSGEVQLSDEILQYCAEEGMNLDWLFVGDLTALLQVFRDKKQASQELAGILSPLNARQTAGLNMAMTAHLNHGVPMEVALAEFCKVV